MKEKNDQCGNMEMHDNWFTDWKPLCITLFCNLFQYESMYKPYITLSCLCWQYFCSLSGKELICWNGHDTAMSVESCPAISSAPTGQTLMGQTAGESSSNETKTFCYYLMYQTVNSTSSTLSFEKNPISARLSHINASCDVQGLCNSSIVQKPVQVWSL